MRVIDIADLPASDSGSARELQGFEHGGFPASLIFLDMPPGGGPDWHQHDYTELFVVLEGEATFEVGDERGIVRGGQMAVAPPRTPHRFVNTGETALRQIDIHLNERFATDWLPGHAAAGQPSSTAASAAASASVPK
jgi:mannose-6-phosphate isomerase-like protein (cupin superfamily)